MYHVVVSEAVWHDDMRVIVVYRVAKLLKKLYFGSRLVSISFSRVNI